MALGVAARGCDGGSGAAVAVTSPILGAGFDAGRMLAGATMPLMPGPQSGTGCSTVSVDTGTGAKPGAALGDGVVLIRSCTSLPFAAVKLAVS